MSVRTAYLRPTPFSPLPSGPSIRPMAMPATGALIGTPASISASVEPQVEPIEVEPFDSKTSDVSSMV